jgi:hypothetical protein
MHAADDHGLPAPAVGGGHEQVGEDPPNGTCSDHGSGEGVADPEVFAKALDGPRGEKADALVDEADDDERENQGTPATSNARDEPCA